MSSGAPITGELLRDEALEIVRAHKARLVREVQRRLLLAALAREDSTFTTDDAAADITAEYQNGGKHVGAAVRALAERGLTEEQGSRRSARPSRHAGRVLVWRLKDRRAAVEWLATHPELPESALYGCQLRLPFPEVPNE